MYNTILYLSFAFYLSKDFIISLMIAKSRRELQKKQQIKQLVSVELHTIKINENQY